MEIEQINVRAPGEARASIVRIAKLLRDTPTFLHQLNRFLDEIDNPDTGAFLAQRMDRLEHQMAELLAARDAVRGASATPPRAEDETISMFPDMPAALPAEWVTGEGRGRRLTAEGDAELRRLISTGKTDTQIADRLGVKPFSVTTKRKRIAEETVS